MSLQRLSRVISTIINSNHNINNVLSAELIQEINTYCQETDEIYNKLKIENEILNNKVLELQNNIVSTQIKLNSNFITMKTDINDNINTLKNDMNIIKNLRCKKFCNNYYNYLYK